MPARSRTEVGPRDNAIYYLEGRLLIRGIPAFTAVVWLGTGLEAALAAQQSQPREWFACRVYDYKSRRKIA